MIGTKTWVILHKSIRDMIKAHGVTPHHRMSFNLIDRQQKIEFPE
jgi:hypothetical protein